MCIRRPLEPQFGVREQLGYEKVITTWVIRPLGRQAHDLLDLWSPIYFPLCFGYVGIGMSSFGPCIPISSLLKVYLAVLL